MLKKLVFNDEIDNDEIEFEFFQASEKEN